MNINKGILELFRLSTEDIKNCKKIKTPTNLKLYLKNEKDETKKKAAIANFLLLAFTDSIENSVFQIIAEVLKLDVSEVKNFGINANLNDDLGADSLDIVEIQQRIEEHHDIDIDDNDVEKILTVNDYIQYIKKETKNDE